MTRWMEPSTNPNVLRDGYPDMLLDDTHAFVTPRDMGRLLEYSSTLPTGVYPGKVWKRLERTLVSMPGRPRYVVEHWYLGAYEEHPTDESMCQIHWRTIIIQT